MKDAMKKNVWLGRMRVPIWAPIWVMIAALAVTGVAAGQAVGPVLSGSVTGSAGLTVEQTLTLDTDLALGSNPATAGADDSVTTRNDDGSEFSIAVEMNVGQTVYACLYLENASEADAAAVLELQVPKGIDVEVEEFSSTANAAVACAATMDDDGLVEEAQMGRENWLMTVAGGIGAANNAGTDDNDGIRITFEPKDDLKPGFYTISGRLVQISG